jgi:anti-anti-sigma factor
MTKVFSFAVGLTNESVVVRVAGHATREHSPAFVTFISAIVKQSSGQRLVVDLGTCQFLDSTFLGCLVVLYRRTQSHMCLCATEPQREQLFSSARIDRLIPVLQPGLVASPTDWQDIRIDHGCDDEDLVRNVAVAHRCLTDIEGPNADLYRDVADQLESELESRSSD